MRRSSSSSAVGLLLVVGLVLGATIAPPSAVAATAVPRYDHVLMVIMENHSADSIIPNAAAPYINSLAGEGASMTQSYGVTHPSQPNYIALFSGSLHGVVDNTCPNTLTAENLGSQLIAAGLSFTGYSESMPSAGYTACQAAGGYARKHNPWVNFSNLPASVNQPLTSLPTDWATLPTVSIVVPNLLNDMHDGTIGQADSWLRDRFDGYLQWAKLHNSLLIVTFDEDDNTAGNRIPTIFAGAGVRSGQYPERITHYNVLRTLQDMYGLAPLGASATAGAVTDIWATSPTNQAPVPAFSGSCVELACSVNGSASADPDGTIASYAWDWGDGTTSTGVTASHSFAAAGARTVTLLVTDNLGRSASVSKVITATTAPGQPFAVDSFARTRTSGWGPADVGGNWTVGSSANSAVGGGAGSLTVNLGQTNPAVLPAVSSSDTDLQTAFAVDRLPTGNGVYLSIIGRRAGANLEYGARVMVRADGKLGLLLTSLAGTSTAVVLKPQIIVPAVGMANGAAAKIRLQVTGTAPTTIRAKVWAATATEPAAWQLTATDSFAGLQAPGSVGVSPYLSSSSTISPIVLRFRDFSARPTNRPPSAAFTTACTLLDCSVDSAGSADPDGSIASYAWSWGDGTTGAGAIGGHTYAVAGSYTVTLTVTDNRGTSSSVSHVVTVTGGASNLPPSAVATVSCVQLVCTASGAGSADPDGTIASYVWSWGDGGTGTGPTSTHTYAAAGSYPVALTVTDNAGATAGATRTATPTAAPTGPFAADSFARTLSAGWGSADKGGAWTVSGLTSKYSVGGGVGSMTARAGETDSAVLQTVSSTATDFRTTLTTSALATGNGTYITLIGRRVGTNLVYQAGARVRADGSVAIKLTALTGTSTAVTVKPEIAPTGLTIAGGKSVTARFQVTGTAPTTLRLKVWMSGTAEPAAWQLTATDTTAALQAAGSVGVAAYVSSASTVTPVTVRVSDLSAARATG